MTFSRRYATSPSDLWHAITDPERVARWLGVEVRADEGQALLVLVHRGLEPGSAASYGAGWHTYLDDLGVALEDGNPTGWDVRWTAVLPAYESAWARVTGGPGGPAT